MMKKIGLILFAVVALFIETRAQQMAEYSMHMFDKLYVNPGYTGARDLLTFSAMSRWQWVNIEGAQRSQMFSAHTPVGVLSKSAIGLHIAKDAIGVDDQITLMGSYAYRLPFDNGSKLSIGISAGLHHINSRLNELEIISQDDVFEPFKANNFNTGVGAFYYNRKYYVGFSIPQMLKTSLRESGKIVANGDLESHMERQYTLMGGYVFGDDAARVKWKPTMLARYVENTPFDLEANLNALLYQDRLWLGLGYRIGGDRKEFDGDALIALIEVLIKKQIRVGYTYDWTLSQLNSHNSGSHEIMVAFDLERGESERFVTPRFIRYF